MDHLILLSVSVFAGFLGSLLGLGGGIIVVPALTLIFGIDIRYAVAASLISIVATSSGAAASYLRDHLTNLRLAVFLEVGTVTGAIVGFLISKQINASALFLLFGALLMFSGIMMLRKRGDHLETKNHPWAEHLELSGDYTKPSGEKVIYKIARVPAGLFIMFGAGILSALLGIGSGIFKVLAMDGMMKIPMKVSSATSNFMIGVTAAGSAGAYLLSGDIRPEIACPVAIGIIAGSWIGAAVMPRIPATVIRRIFVVVIFITSIQMITKGLQL
ncbi:MAG: permease [Bdellovibrio sp. SCN 50-8]|nr:MAG: permease [Bdellovibrio sp. SCN 50-8]